MTKKLLTAVSAVSVLCSSTLVLAQDFETKSFRENDSLATAFSCAFVGDEYEYYNDARVKLISFMRANGATDEEIEPLVDDAKLWMQHNRGKLDFETLWLVECIEGMDNIETFLLENHPEYFEQHSRP